MALTPAARSSGSSAGSEGASRTLSQSLPSSRGGYEERRQVARVEAVAAGVVTGQRVGRQRKQSGQQKCGSAASHAGLVGPSPRRLEVLARRAARSRGGWRPRRCRLLDRATVEPLIRRIRA